MTQQALRPRPWIEIERMRSPSFPQDAAFSKEQAQQSSHAQVFPEPQREQPPKTVQIGRVERPPPSPPSSSPRSEKSKKRGIESLFVTLLIGLVFIILGRACGSKVGGNLARERIKAESYQANSQYSKSDGPRDENLVIFQSSMIEVEKLLGRYNRSGINSQKDSNHLKVLNNLTALDKRMSRIQTGDLPRELASSFNDYRKTMNGLLSHLNNMPYPTELLPQGAKGLNDWIEKQAARDPKFLGNFRREVDAWEKNRASYPRKIVSATYRLSVAMQRNGIDFDFGTK